MLGVFAAIAAAVIVLIILAVYFSSEVAVSVATTAATTAAPAAQTMPPISQNEPSTTASGKFRKYLYARGPTQDQIYKATNSVPVNKSYEIMPQAALEDLCLSDPSCAGVNVYVGPPEANGLPYISRVVMLTSKNPIHSIYNTTVPADGNHFYLRRLTF